MLALEFRGRGGGGARAHHDSWNQEKKEWKGLVFLMFFVEGFLVKERSGVWFLATDGSWGILALLSGAAALCARIPGLFVTWQSWDLTRFYFVSKKKGP